MIYRKDGYIYAVNHKEMDEQTKEVYEALKTRPEAPEGYAYRLKEDLTWEMFEIPQSEEPVETTDEYAEAGKILLGVSE